MQKGNWAFLADSAEQLTKVAADPAPLLGDLPKRYDLAIRASVKNLPKEYREQLLAQLRAGAEAGMQQMPSESEEDYAMRLGVAKQAVQQLTTLVNDMDEVLLGWNVDAQTKTTYLDLELTAQTGTKLADQFAAIKPGKTNFAGLLLPEAAVTASSVGTISDAQVAQVKSGLATLRKSVTKELENQNLAEDEVKLASRLLGDVIDVVEKTVEAKNSDAALAVMLDPAAVTLLAGATIADGAKLEKTFQQLADEVQKNGQTAAVGHDQRRDLPGHSPARHFDAHAGSETDAAGGRHVGGGRGHRRRQGAGGRGPRRRQDAQEGHRPAQDRRRQGSAAAGDQAGRQAHRQVCRRSRPTTRR